MRPVDHWLITTAAFFSAALTAFISYQFDPTLLARWATVVSGTLGVISLSVAAVLAWLDGEYRGR
jgi:hypothetical protein